jgi:hypothetical protein
VGDGIHTGAGGPRTTPSAARPPQGQTQPIPTHVCFCGYMGHSLLGLGRWCAGWPLYFHFGGKAETTVTRTFFVSLALELAPRARRLGLLLSQREPQSDAPVLLLNPLDCAWQLVAPKSRQFDF